MTTDPEGRPLVMTNWLDIDGMGTLSALDKASEGATTVKEVGEMYRGQLKKVAG